MAKYLTTVVETYRVSTEQEATALIEEAKNDPSYTLGKYTSERKERKSKGEIIDEFWKVSLNKIFNDIKEPETNVNITYEVD